MPTPTDHTNANYDVYAMVRNRLPFVADTPTNKTYISNLTLEAMWQMEPCYRIGYNTDGTPAPEKVGPEVNYSMIQRMIMADLVAVSILVTQSLAITEGNLGEVFGSATDAVTAVFKSRIKAGSVEIDYDQFKVKDLLGLRSNFQTLKDQFTKSAVMKAAAMGCIIDLTDGAVLEILNDMYSSSYKPFIVVQSCGTRPYEYIAERGGCNY